METFLLLVFASLAALTALLELSKRQRSKQETTNRDFVRFRNNYVLVYALMMGGDWLQGPYVYALYQFYGFDRGQIGRLFIGGFASSMIFGTLVGSLADKHGRKKAALAYVFTYTCGCVTKHFNDFNVLFIGRVFSGVATSLLYSAFESWLVAEHKKRGYDEDWLGGTFSQAVFVGNGLMAILSGFLAHTLVEGLNLGPVAPFDAAHVVLLLGGAVVLATWTENFGDEAREQNSSLVTQIGTALQAIRRDRKIALLGAIQSLFEASMYTFVFLWTPALSPNGEKVAHGMIFACFMMSCMAGSTIAGRLLTDSKRYAVSHYMKSVHGLAALALAVPVIFHWYALPDDEDRMPNWASTGLDWKGRIQMAAFCFFELLVGIFWPSMMKLRSQYVPEGIRATTLNLFRVPLNLFVCLVLYNVGSVPLSVMFGMCSLFLLLALWCQHNFLLLSVKSRIQSQLRKGLSASFVSRA
ncbi:g13080 [Coccomyxa viridis]|uniref:Molybdate-anion transporter n=1 Tax=Coccomyxa viridis TaxID=1274662 RepID=A0ABP1GC96_9CHLO